MSKEKQAIATSVRLSEAALVSIDEIAKRDNRSRSWVVSTLINEALAARKGSAR